MNAPDTYNKSLVAASLIRHDILNKNRWKFTVSLNAKKKKNVDVQTKNISEIVITSTKSKKQINDASGEFRENVEIPLSVGLGLYIHQQTWSKKVIDTLSKLNLTILYDRILKVETGIANEISKNIDNNNGVFVPPNIIYNTPLHFAIDNVDFSNDTPDGKNEFHGVGQVVFWKSNTKKETEKSKFTIDTANKTTFNRNILNNRVNGSESN